MFRIFTQKPLTQVEAIAKLSETCKIKCYTTQILAMDEYVQKLPGNNFSVMA